MRELTSNEVRGLEECLRALSEYHNAVSSHFQGHYPSRPYEKTLALFADALKKQTSRIAVVEDNSRIVGFCKIDFDGEKGKLDYLVVLEAYRNRGFGKRLMDWAMRTFEEQGVHQIEVKVVDGNEAIHLYEKYGFRMNAHILVKS